jgi:carbamoyl-phosphate synthase large subunit
LGEGNPNIFEKYGISAKNGEIDLVINTPSGKVSQIDDAFLRKAAIECQVPNITTSTGALAAAKGISGRIEGRPQITSFKEYHALIK